MKKIIALILVGLALFGLSACGSSSDTEKSDPTEPDPTEPEPTKAEADPTDTPVDDPADAPLAGGYTDAESPVVTDEIRMLVEKASAGIEGIPFTPVAYVASQVVAGTNHLILCTNPVASNRYTLVTIYEDLNGNANITAVAACTETAPAPYDPDNPVSGGYGTPADPTVTEEVMNAVIKANDALGTMTYEPKALLKQQVVAGMNYSVLCRGKALNGDDLDYAIVTVYADLDGGAEFTAVSEFSSVDYYE